MASSVECPKSPAVKATLDPLMSRYQILAVIISVEPHISSLDNQVKQEEREWGVEPTLYRSQARPFNPP